MALLSGEEREGVSEREGEGEEEEEEDGCDLEGDRNISLKFAIAELDSPISEEETRDKILNGN